MLAGVMAIPRLHQRQFAVLRALGAPRLYIFLCVWTQIALIVVTGAALGLALGAGAAFVVSQLITRATGIALPTRIGADELLLVSGMILFALLVAFVPAFVSYHRSVIQAFERTIGLFIASLAADYDLRRAYDLGSIIPHRIVDRYCRGRARLGRGTYPVKATERAKGSSTRLIHH
jgi:ABC-type lipoprotein release transport system permease subunit